MIRPSCSDPPDARPLDRAIEQKAADCLVNSPYRVLHTIRCRAHNGILTLSGRVPSFHMKQVAQATVMNEAHIAQVVNQLEVPRTSHVSID